MDKLEKEIFKLSTKEKMIVQSILESLDSGDIRNLDIKKFKGHDDIYRARKGNMRIVFRIVDGEYIVVAIKRRNEKTYKGLQLCHKRN